MKKVGILTFHMAFNHGAMLQAYGLSKQLNEMGVDARIIDYRLPYIDRYHHKDVLSDLWRKERYIGVLRFIKRNVFGGYYTPSWKKFYHFMTRKLPLSKQVMCDGLPYMDFDCYITGSDQVWNGDLTGGIQPCYLLDFVPLSAKRISYAASSGGADFGATDIDEVRNMLKRFDAIGIREKRLTDYVNSELQLSAQTVLDPTLILSRELWKELVHKVPEDKYILIYTFDEKPYIYERAREYAHRHNLKILTLVYEKKDLSEDIKQIFDQGPEDFVSYIYHAEVVFTSSFHGTAFSLIFEKEFFCFPHPLYHERTDNLLEIAGLEERYVYENSVLIDKKIDYLSVRNKMKPEIDASIQFLQENVIGE